MQPKVLSKTVFSQNIFAKCVQMAGTVSLSLLAGVSYIQPGLAQQPTTSIEESTIIFNAPPPPPGQGAPTGRRDGGASRGDCPEYSNLAALVPVAEGTVWGQTTAAQPTLWFYLPAAVTPETAIELTVQDGENNFLYETSLSVEMAAGTFAIALPETVTLPASEPHLWTLALYCDSERPTASVFVNGTIERVAADGVAPLAVDTVRSLSQAQSYADAGIWHDALTVLGELQQAGEADADVQAAWSALLEQIELERAAIVPVQPCCESL